MAAWWTELRAAIAGDSVRQIGAKAWSMALARLYLHRATCVGQLTRVYGRPIVANGGTLRIGAGVGLWSQVARSELRVYEGGLLEIGDRTLINHGSVIHATGAVRIGADCLIGMYSIILDNDFHELEQRHVRPAPRPVVLEDNVWLGHRTMIMPGVTVGRDAVIGAGSVVTTSIPPRSLAMGNPARVMRTF